MILFLCESILGTGILLSNTLPKTLHKGRVQVQAMLHFFISKYTKGLKFFPGKSLKKFPSGNDVLFSVAKFNFTFFLKS